jgi:hypothetical protein
MPSTAATLTWLRRHARESRAARVQVLVRAFRQRARALAQPRVMFSRTRCAQVTGSLYLVGDFLRLLKPRATK